MTTMPNHLLAPTAVLFTVTFAKLDGGSNTAAEAASRQWLGFFR